MEIADKNFEYFKKHHDDLFSKYPNRYLLISDEDIKGDFNSFEDALVYASNNNFELGKYIIQYCSEGTEGYTQRFHSRVFFA